MPTPQGLPSLEEALGSAAVVEGFGDDPEDVLFPEPAEQAEPAAEPEHTQQEDQATSEEELSPFAELVAVDEQAAPPRGGVDWDEEVALPGQDGTVKLSEIRDGYLRQADYTRKTQTLAAERKAFEQQSAQALKLMQALETDPAGTAAALAVRLGLVEEGQIADKVGQLRDVWQPPPSAEQVEAEVQRRVDEAVKKHPTVLEAQAAAIGQRVEREFNRIEQKHQLKLTAKDKTAILKKATESGTADLELVVEGMLRRIERSRQAQDTAREAAPARPSVRSSSSDAPAKPKTVEDAFALALQQMEKGGAS